MPNMPPHMPQLSSPQQSRVNSMLPNPGFNEVSPMRMQSISGQQNQPSDAYRKMPVLDEAPPSLRGPSPYSPQQLLFLCYLRASLQCWRISMVNH